MALDEACPAVQAVHFVAPGAASASVVEPPPHSLQLVACVPEYNPATQSAQAVLAFDEAWPAAHAVHVVPPADPSVSVTEPPLQAVHTDDSAPLYCPALHVLHATAASSLALRLLPAVQPLQKLCACTFWYLPLGHAVQLAALLAPWPTTYWPVVQPMQLAWPSLGW